MREKKKEDNNRKIIIEEKENSKSLEYKSVTFSRRFAAYIMDILLLGIIFSVFNFIIPTSEKVESINNEMTELATQYGDKKITTEEYADKVAPLDYQLSKENYVHSLISLVLTIAYFVVYQYKNKATLGKKIMGIKVVKEPGEGELQVNDFIYRSLIVNDLFATIIGLSILFLVKEKTYLMINSSVVVFQGMLLLASGLFIIIRKDKKSLHDILTKTKVVEVK